MTHLSKRPKGLLTLLQALTVLVAAVGTWMAVVLGILGWFAATEIFASLPEAAETGLEAILFACGGLATVVIVSVCCYVALGSFFILLQRMKKETAFTRRNCRALGRMAFSCAVAAAVLFLMMGYIAFGVFVPTMSFTNSLWQFVDKVCVLMAWPFGFLVVSLLLQGVRVLMVRAMTLREEQALVI